jgi:hypothetical protein
MALALSVEIRAILGWIWLSLRYRGVLEASPFVWFVWFVVESFLRRARACAGSTPSLNGRLNLQIWPGGA